VAVTASYRLPQSVRPVRYRIELTPDLASARFSGRVEITLDVQEAVKEVVLNATELDLVSAVLRSGASTVTQTADISLDETLEQAYLVFDDTVPSGSATLTVEFTGILNDFLHGFYRSTFVGEDGHEHVIATTQFESTDARRAFPCWDEPEFKATFALSMIVPEELTVLSSGAETSSVRLGDGTRRVTFAETMRMSTYVLAWVVGPFELTEPVDVDGVPLRLAVAPGRLGMTPFGIDAASHALRFLSSYFDIPYPSDKIDHVAIPDFAFGAMENLGCVTYREEALLADAAVASQRELMRVAQVIAHETAHMWFGDLVTMKWWNGIWLNEAFATFMELKTTEAFRSDWQVWTAFGAGKAAALAVDGLRATRPIEIEVGPPEEAEAMFDVLTYQKGGSVLRMLEQYLGEETFKKGITRYLVEHRHANTETSDLWDALEAASGEPVRATMDSWIFQGGYPLVSVAGAPGSARVTLSQQRFLYTPDGGASPATGGDGHWVIPVNLRASVGGAIVKRRALVDGPTVVDFGGPVDWVIANEGAWGFYRSAYSPELRAALDGDLLTICSPLERMSLVGDTWAAVLAGVAPLSAWVTLVGHLAAEDDPDVWSAVAGPLGLLDLVVSDTDRPVLQAFVRRVAGPAFAAIGWDPAPEEPERIAITRGRLVSLLGTSGADPAVRAEATARFERSASDPSAVAPDLVAAVINVVAAAGGEAAYGALLERYHAALTPQDQARCLSALAGFPDPEHLMRSLEMALSDEVRSQDGPFQIASVLFNRAGGEAAWAWVEANQGRIEARFPRNLRIRIFEGVAGFVDASLVARASDWFASTTLVIGGGPRIAQLEERMNVNVAFSARVGHDLAATLA
jgi:puromycin-sensitive aminopeptidase